MPRMGEFTKERAIAELFSRIKTGSYTGDGSTSQAISEIGFRPKHLIISTIPDVDAASQHLYHKTDQMANNWSVVVATALYEKDDRVVSLDSDGFTVDDDGGNQHPNKLGQVYVYTAWG